MASQGLTDIERAAVQILLERNLNAALAELNMAEKLPAIKALPEVVKKITAMMNDSARKAAESLEAAGNRGQQVVDKYVQVAKEIHATLDEAEKGTEEGPTTNAGPLSQS